MTAGSESVCDVTDDDKKTDAGIRKEQDIVAVLTFLLMMTN